MKRRASLNRYLLWIAFFLGASNSAFGQTLVLRDRIEAGNGVTVQDAFSPLDADSSAKVNPTELSDLGPRPGYVTLRYLQEQWNVSGAGAFVGSGSLWLPKTSGTDGEREQIASLIEFLKKNWSQKTFKASFESSAFFIEGFDLPQNLPTEVEWKLVSTSYRQGLLSGRQVVQALTKGTSKPVANLAFNVSSYVLVPQTTRDLGTKTLLQSSDWKWASRNVLEVPSDAWDAKEPTSLETTKSLAISDILRPNANVRVVFPVNPGEGVTLTLTKGNLSVELQAIALETGRLGQSIRVRAENGKTFTADVVDWRQVRQDLP